MNKFLRRFILALFVTVLSGANYVCVRADDWQLSTDIYKTVASDVESIVQSGAGLQVSLHRKSLFLYLSKDVNQVRFAGQGGPDVNLWSAGIGMQHKAGKHLTISLDIGWYEPIFKENGEPQSYYSSSFAEGLNRYLNNFLMPDYGGQTFYPVWDYYSLEYHGSIGGKISLAFEYPITKRASFNLTGGYRYLKLLENVKGEDYDGGYARLGEAGCWTIRYDRNFSAWIIGGAFVYRF